MGKESRILILLFIAIITALCSGCSSSNGWRFEIGVSPVNGLENTAQFQTVTTKQNDDRRY